MSDIDKEIQKVIVGSFVAGLIFAFTFVGTLHLISYYVR